MSTTITGAGPGRISVSRDGERYSGFTTGVPSNSFTIRKLAAKPRDSGWLVRTGDTGAWKPLGLLEHAGLMYVYGPAVTGVYLDEALHDEARNHMADLVAVADALAALTRANHPVDAMHTRSVVLLDSGGVLVLPADVRRSIMEHQELGEQLRTVEPFTHPDRDAVANVGFFLAALAYHVFTGRLPYEAETSEDLHVRIRDGRPVNPRYHRATLAPDVSRTLADTLDGSRYEPDPVVWRDRFVTWDRDGIDVELSEAERVALEREAREQIQRLDRAFRRKESVRKNWRTALIIVAVAVVVGLVPGTIIRNALKPRATAGLSAAEVVTVFYTSINTLDHMTMEDAVVGDAGRPLVREVLNLYVIDRQRMSVEMRSGFVDAAQWRAAGMPPLDEGVVPYGVVGLSLEPLPAPEGEARFRVRYERWLPYFPEEDEPPVTGERYIGYDITDEVALRRDREDWVIYDMRTVDRQ